MKRLSLLLLPIMVLVLGSALVGTRSVIVDSTTGGLVGVDTNFFRNNSNAINAVVSAVGGGVSASQSNSYYETGIEASNAMNVASSTGAGLTNLQGTVANLQTNITPSYFASTNSGQAGYIFVWLSTSNGYWANPSSLGLTNSSPSGTAATISIQPTNLTVLTNSTVNFYCVGAGTEPLSYQWFTNGAAVSGATTTNLQLANVQIGLSNAQIKCVVTNAYGAATSTVATLTVTNGVTPETPTGIDTNGLVIQWVMGEGDGEVVTNSAAPNFTAAANKFVTTKNMFNSPLFWGADCNGMATDGVEVSPTGDLTASRIVVPSGDNSYYTTAVLTNGLTYTLSVYLKSTGAVQTVRLAFADNTSEDFVVSNSWQRYSVSGGAPYTGLNFIRLVKTGSGGSAVDVLLWGAQFEVGATPSTFATDDQYTLTLGKFRAMEWDDQPSSSNAYLHYISNKIAYATAIGTNTFSNFTAYVVLKPMLGWTQTYSVPLRADSSFAFGSQFDYSKETFGVQWGGTYAYASSAICDGLWHCLAAEYDGSYLSLYADGKLVGFKAGAVNAQTLKVFNLGATANAAFWNYAGDLGPILMYSNAHSASQIFNNYLALSNSMAAKGVTFTTPNQLVIGFEGDSITDSPNVISYPTKTMRLLGRPANGPWAATGAATLATARSRTNWLDRCVVPGATNVLVVFFGANDLQSQSASNFVADLKTYCMTRRTAGWNKIVVCTVLPNGLTGFNAKRNEANTLIVADPSFYDAIADFGADATMGPDSAYSDTTYYSDTVHPTQTGQNILAPICSAAILTVL